MWSRRVTPFAVETRSTPTCSGGRLISDIRSIYAHTSSFMPYFSVKECSNKRYHDCDLTSQAPGTG